MDKFDKTGICQLYVDCKQKHLFLSIYQCSNVDHEVFQYFQHLLWSTITIILVTHQHKIRKLIAIVIKDVSNHRITILIKSCICHI